MNIIWWQKLSKMATKCPKCDKAVYHAEEVKAIGKSWHKRCLKCYQCNKALDTGSINDRNGEIYCKMCYRAVNGPAHLVRVEANLSGGATLKATYADNANNEQSALDAGFTTGYAPSGESSLPKEPPPKPEQPKEPMNAGKYGFHKGDEPVNATQPEQKFVPPDNGGKLLYVRPKKT